MYKFHVIKLKKVYLGVFSIFLGIFIMCFFSYFFNSTILEVNGANRLIPIYSVETDQKEVAITFDCAWGANDISNIVDTLKANEAEATFFVVGDWVTKYPEATKVLSDNNMEIANHSDSHAHVNNMSYEKNIEDMKKCNEKIKNITGKDIQFYRGPYGEYNNTVIKAAESLQMKVVQWDIDTLDYTGKTPDEMCERIKSKIRNGSIILMHNDTEHTAEGLQKIIDCIKEEGYEIVSLSELIYFDNYKINHEGRQIKE